MIKVHAIGERSNGNLHDVAHIRLYLPLQCLANNNEIILTKDVSYESSKNSDVFFVQRTWTDRMTQRSTYDFIDFIKSHHKKLIYEIDDNLLEIEHISSYQKAVIRILAKNADVVIVSTSNLKERMSRLNPNTIVIPNYLSNELISKTKYINNNNEIVIGCAGTFTHQEDFQMIKLPLMRILSKYRDNVRLEIVGSLSDPSAIRSLPNSTILQMDGVYDYFSYWKWAKKAIHWDIGLAPLKTNHFSICKSDIKYLDYSALGIPGIFSEHPAYQNTISNKKNGILVENNCDAWIRTMEEMISDPSLRKNIIHEAIDDLRQNRMLKERAHSWMNVIELVVAGRSY